ncbi:MAG: hypothetical protein R3B09_20160 [Nannocystaceae bacterium]
MKRAADFKKTQQETGLTVPAAFGKIRIFEMDVDQIVAWFRQFDYSGFMVQNRSGSVMMRPFKRAGVIRPLAPATTAACAPVIVEISIPAWAAAVVAQLASAAFPSWSASPFPASLDRSSIRIASS